MFTAERVAEQLPKTDQFDRYLRDYNDTTTWFAEVLDGSMRTPFEYNFDGQELYADDGAALRPIFEDALQHAEQIITNEPVLSFEKRRRQHELDEYEDMIAMAKGSQPNTMVVVSDFPEELQHARADVGGYNTTRKQTMLRVIYWQDGRMHMLSQSLDDSNRHALEALYSHMGANAEQGELLGQRIHANLDTEDQKYLIDRLTGVYDRDLEQQFGGVWHAGRKEAKLDTFAFAKSQHDLVDRYIAAKQTGTLSNYEEVNILATLDARYARAKQPEIVTGKEQLVCSAFRPPIPLAVELRAMGDAARATGKTFSGCGGTVRAGESSAESQMNELGYGNDAGESNDDGGDGLGPLTFRCTEGHTNTRKKGQLLKECHVKGCKKGSVGCG
ncbi:MAG: hypothetical protein QG629_647 [Patescibacteria group bacterium]|nr:hypothetical protein [Candidatus Saccharibacteria bacterium]MDQ5963565.1 hypothetical protein [Patescibacteria group bacterium]